jgi:type II restriction/modification system DNA methylase subunit YeeA
MTPQEFIAKWRRSNLRERSACQQHFCDLCDMLGQPKPAEADPEGTWYTFDRGVRKTTGDKGFADVWMQGHFGWEYKGKHKDLKEAYQQLLLYREALENPCLLVVCDMDRFEVNTNFTNTAKQVHRFDLSGLAEPANLDVLRKVFTDPEALRPDVTPEKITEDAAERFADLAKRLRMRKGISAQRAAHFLMKLMFCMFGVRIELLPAEPFAKLLQSGQRNPAALRRRLEALFAAMSTGGDFGPDEILWFNGGLFGDTDVIPLQAEEINILANVNGYDWASVEPSIFGTLFERTLDPDKRSQIGAHYTSRVDIETLVNPVVMVPLRREWEEVKRRCEEKLWPAVVKASQAQAAQKRRTAKPSPAREKFDRAIQDFIERLAHVTVLDPACGSGNFLYVALHLLLDLEKEVISYAASHGLSLVPHVHPRQLAGLEINPFAQQLASVVLWIGYLQWIHRNGFKPPSHPVLEPIETIRCQDAILDLSDPKNPKEPEWPAAEFIVSNPPFLGDKKMRGELGDEYVDEVRRLYHGRLSRQSDLCCYWFEKARAQISSAKCGRAGLLATQGIRGGANRKVLDRVKESGDIFWALSDRDWILDGATVHVSMAAFDNGSESGRLLDEKPVDSIFSNLTPGHSDKVSVTSARSLATNAEICYLGVMKAGDFDLDEQFALEITHEPNPNGVPNSDVLRPRVNSRDILQRMPLRWIVDFGCNMEQSQAASYAAPWQILERKVKAKRLRNRRKRLAEKWWIHGEPRPGMRRVLRGLSRFIVTPEVSKHRIFVWLECAYLADHQTRVFGRPDDYFFGVLHSRVHEVWARAQGTQLRERESGFRYTPTTCFETFPFPEPTAGQGRAIAAAAKELDELRNRWLNPPEWTKTEVLEFPGSVDGPWARYIDPATVRPHRPHPDPLPKGEGTIGDLLPEGEGTVGTVRWPRLVPKDPGCAESLKKRTLTNLYNERPTWLDLAHKKLDRAVFAAYGWDPGISDDELLGRLLELNLALAK